jgi:malate synthase
MSRSNAPAGAVLPLEFRRNLEQAYPDIHTPEIKGTLSALAHLEVDRKALMTARIRRRADRARKRERITFLDPAAPIGRTGLTVADVRSGAFEGSDIPTDLKRQWIQGTAPAATPKAPIERSIRNDPYAQH